MRACHRCRSENFDDQKFCNFCGARVPRDLGADLFGRDGPVLLGNAVPQPATQVQGDPQEAYRCFTQGRARLAAGDVSQAVTFFQKALDADPGDPQIRRLLERAVRLREASTSRPGPVARGAAGRATPQARAPELPGAPERNDGYEAPVLSSEAPLSRAQAVGRSREWIESLQPVPAWKPAAAIDGAPESPLREIGVSLLLVLGMMAFAYLLVF
jgi:hypothetical protein